MSSRSGKKSQAPERGELICPRDHGLADVSDQALQGLTHLLYMDGNANISQPGQEWLDRQAQEVKQLDDSVRRPKALHEKLAVSMGKRKVKFFPQAARLCAAHEGLDPRVVRNLMLLVGHEVTLRTDKFRKWRKYVKWTEKTMEWLDRVDAVTGMWFKPEAFERLFGYHRVIPGMQTVESGCEACIMAVMGARPQVLCDLRAGLLARKERRRRKRTPRLLRAVDAWIARYDSGHTNAIRSASDDLAKEIGLVMKDMDEEKKRREEKRKKEGRTKKHRRHRHRRHHERSKKEEDEEPLIKKGERPANVPGWYKLDGSMGSRPPSEVLLGTNSSPMASSDDDDIHPGVEASDWLLGRMQDLDEEDRRTVLSNIHPAFSEYKAFSAVPSALDVSKDDGDFKEFDTAAEFDTASWGPYSVHTGMSLPSWPSISGIPRGTQPYAWGSEDEDDDYDDEDVDENGDYIPARGNWAAASSVYSQDSRQAGESLKSGNSEVTFKNPWASILGMNGWGGSKGSVVSSAVSPSQVG